GEGVGGLQGCGPPPGGASAPLPTPWCCGVQGCVPQGARGSGGPQTPPRPRGATPSSASTEVRGGQHGGGCFSSVGRVGGPQLLSLAPPCLQGGKGVALHELLHAVGFGHEHSRPDRDAFISIAWSHVLPGFEGNFMKSRSANTLVGYDYSSVLHYGRYAFSRGAEPTITPLRDPRAVLGQRRGLSASDVARVNRLYGCPQGGWHRGGTQGVAAPQGAPSAGWVTPVLHPGPLTAGTPLSVGTRSEATPGGTEPTAGGTAPARCTGTDATATSP
uniref:Metalloendopeptidase n=1 Tax=Anas zonorhyncha TaxID=75864 RepID=A0A8B9UP29_9AVES